MILEKIVLHNYGVFGGHQEVNLTPEKGKPIILFGGMNGSGKTTFLDAIQLVFFGDRARISNRGRLAYKDYLRESIHRKGNSKDGAGISIGFSRSVQGEISHFELHRHWHETASGIEEALQVFCNGKPDDLLAENWEESIESFLSSGISHLFFFDGEQIMELAEGHNTTAILGTAIQSLLGLDLVDRLEADLRIFERRKKNSDANIDSSQRLTHAQRELQEANDQEEKCATLEGSLVNEVERAAKALRDKEDLFRREGGELFLRRKELEVDLETVKTNRSTIEAKYRELVSGAFPLLMVKDLINIAKDIAHQENEIRHSRDFLEVLTSRDNKTISQLESHKIDTHVRSLISKLFEEDRKALSKKAKEPIIFDADNTLAGRLTDLHDKIIPFVERQASEYAHILDGLNERITRLDTELARVPTEERISEVQNQLNTASNTYEIKATELRVVRTRRATLQQLRLAAEARLNKIENEEIDARFAEDSRLRMLKHSRRVRDTLRQYRTNIIQNHTSHIEKLVIESFHNLLYKKKLVNRIAINPETFETTLVQSDGRKLPFERLSAGEKQLLATSLLWGLAKASGRPLPTVIDTPLGRLDSSHRRFLVERYFPNASHQVLLLSTDEEIVGSYLDMLEPFISRKFLFSHDLEHDGTQIQIGYFGKRHEATG